MVILVHGGFWRAQYGLDWMDALAEDLSERGIASWNIEYRRVGDPGGGGWPGTLQDVACAADHLRVLAGEHELDLRRVVAVGHSAGGHLAFWLAGRTRMPAATRDLFGGEATPLPLCGAVSLAGVVDLREGWKRGLGHGAVQGLIGGSPQKFPERFAAASPAELLPLGVPQVIVHGSADDRVPLELSQDYASSAAAAGDEVRMHALPGVDHFAPIEPASDAWSLTVDEIMRLQQSS